MQYYLIYPNLSDIVARGDMLHMSDFQWFNKETGQWEASAWAYDKIFIDSFNHFREISEQEAQRIIQAA